MLDALADLDLAWDLVDVFQVDERVVPHDDPRRNLGAVERTLGARVAASLHPMPVDDDDLDAAARRYEASLPDAFAVVHLGLGDDGHTASLFPGDPLLDETERGVAVTAVRSDGTRRMTLTYPGLARAREVLWLVGGSAKRAALARLLAEDPAIPAARVPVADQTVVTDLAAGAGA